MNRGNLATYLNDHLAGSVAALELLDHLIEATDDIEDQSFLGVLRRGVADDQEVLRKILKRVDASESMTRKAGAWLMEKIARAKLRFDGPKESPFGRMEAMEALLVGITGKRALWLALASSVEELRDFRFGDLVRQAEQQMEAVEAKRIEAAREALR